jgi:hypothetical protein
MILSMSGKEIDKKNGIYQVRMRIGGVYISPTILIIPLKDYFDHTLKRWYE